MGLDSVDESNDHFSQNQGFDSNDEAGQDVSRNIQDVAYNIQVITASVYVELISAGVAR